MKRRRRPALRGPRSAARRLLGVLAASLLLVSSRPAHAAPPAEWRYVDEEDEAEAEKLLSGLLKKHDTPAKCAALVKTLRGKRSWPKAAKDSDTVEVPGPDGKTRSFTYLLPPKYSPGRAAGVMFWFHGAIRQPAPGGGAGEARMFRPAVEDLGLIVVGPSTYDGVEWGTTACRGLVRHALAWLKRRFHVDENRVYLCGDSDGGRGTYAMAETEATFVAAAIPVIGSPGGVTRFLNLRNLPWFAINGEKDSIFDVVHVREMVEGMKAAGIDLEWKLVANGPHDPRFFLTYGEEVRAFLKAHVRDPHPPRIDWSVDPSRDDPGFPANTFRWLRIEEAATGAVEGEASFDDESGLLAARLPRASATREGNRIEVRTRGVARVTVLVSDEALDLKQEVEVLVNGRPAFRGRVEPDARVILEEARRFRDRRLVFVNRIPLDVAAR